MRPTASEMALGGFLALIEPPPPESAGDFAAGRAGAAAMVSALVAQEAEQGARVRAWENAAMRALFASAAGRAPEALRGRLKAAAAGGDLDLGIAALDRANAELRTLLIALHEAAEADPGPAGRTLEREILDLLLQSARARRLYLPTEPPPAG